MSEQIAHSHGFTYSHDCKCANPGRVYKKGKVQLTLHSRQPTFLLKRVGPHNVSGRIENLEHTLTNYGL